MAAAESGSCQVVAISGCHHNMASRHVIILVHARSLQGHMVAWRHDLLAGWMLIYWQYSQQIDVNGILTSKLLSSSRRCKDSTSVSALARFSLSANLAGPSFPFPFALGGILRR